jgi:hypothetical protein
MSIGVPTDWRRGKCLIEANINRSGDPILTLLMWLMGESVDVPYRSVEQP